MGVCVGCAFIRESEKERYMMMYVYLCVHIRYVRNVYNMHIVAYI